MWSPQIGMMDYHIAVLLQSIHQSASGLLPNASFTCVNILLHVKFFGGNEPFYLAAMGLGSIPGEKGLHWMVEWAYWEELLCTVQLRP